MKKIATMVTAVVMTILMNMTCNAAALSSKITNVAATSGANKTLYVIGDSYSSFDVNNTRSNAFYYPFNKTDDNDVSSLEDTWREKLAKKAGLSVIGVDAYSGSSITDSNPESKLIYSFVVYDDEMTMYEKAARAICEEECVTFVPIYGREISCKGWHPTVAGMEAIANKLLPYVTGNDVFSASVVTCATISGI